MNSTEDKIQSIFTNDGLHEIVKYLPITYFDQDNNEYQQFLIDAYHVNSHYELSEYAFLSFHMLFVSYLYKTLRQYSHFKYKDIDKYTDAVMWFKRKPYRNFITYYSPFDIVQVGEREIKEILTEIDTLENIDLIKYRDIRNECAHTNGRVIYTQEQVDEYISTMLEIIQSIEEKKEQEFFAVSLGLEVLENITYDKLGINMIFSQVELLYLYKNKEKYDKFEHKLKIVKLLLDESYFPFISEIDEFSITEIIIWLLEGYTGDVVELFRDELLEDIIILPSYVYEDVSKLLFDKGLLTQGTQL